MITIYKKIIIVLFLATLLFAYVISRPLDTFIFPLSKENTTISISDVIALPNETIINEIKIENLDNFTGILEVKLTYNPNVVIVQGVTDKDFSVVTSRNDTMYFTPISNRRVNGTSVSADGVSAFTGSVTSIDNITGRAMIVAVTNKKVSGNITFVSVLLKAVGSVNDTSSLDISWASVQNVERREQNAPNLRKGLRTKSGKFTIS